MSLTPASTARVNSALRVMYPANICSFHCSRRLVACLLRGHDWHLLCHARNTHRTIPCYTVGHQWGTARERLLRLRSGALHDSWMHSATAACPSEEGPMAPLRSSALGPPALGHDMPASGMSRKAFRRCTRPSVKSRLIDESVSPNEC